MTDHFNDWEDVWLNWSVETQTESEPTNQSSRGQTERDRERAVVRSSWPLKFFNPKQRLQAAPAQQPHSTTNNAITSTTTQKTTTTPPLPTTPTTTNNKQHNCNNQLFCSSVVLIRVQFVSGSSLWCCFVILLSDWLNTDVFMVFVHRVNWNIKNKSGERGMRGGWRTENSCTEGWAGGHSWILKLIH